MWIKLAWQSLVNIGMSSELNALEAKRVQLLNSLNGVVLVGIFVGILLNFFMFNINALLLSVFSLAVQLVIPIMHWYRKYFMARVYIIFLMLFFNLIIAYLFGEDLRNEYIFCLLPPVAFVLFSYEKKIQYVAVFFACAAFLTCKLIYEYTDPILSSPPFFKWLTGLVDIFIMYYLFLVLNSEINQALNNTQSLLEKVNAQKQEIEQKKNELALIMNNSPSCISYVNKYYEYQFNNNTYFEWFGITEEELEGQHVSTILGEKTFREDIKQHLDKAFTGRKMYYEGVTEFATQQKKNVRGAFIPDIDDNKTIKGCFIFIEDITPLKRVELALRKEVKERTNTEKLLKRYNEELKNFAYVTSHNLRSPLANVIGLIKLYDHQQPTNEFNTIIVDNVEKATQTMDEVLQDLNDIISIKNEAVTLKTSISFQETLEKTLQIINKQIKEANAKIITDFSKVPKAQAVKSYMDSLMLNFLTNAIKYCSPTRQPIIQLKTEKTLDNKVCLSIQDNGIGIDLVKNKEKIFGLYKRFHTHIEGRGLGLHLVKKQVEAMGGTITVESEVDKGTIFKVYL